MKKVILAISLLATPALAQQPTPGEQALGSKLMREMQEGLNCSTNLVLAQAEIAKAQAELKRLKDKYEPESKKD